MLLIKCAILRPDFISGVSNTWPAWCDCVARVIIKNLKIWMKLQFYAELSSFNPLLWVFSTNATRELIFFQNSALAQI